MVDSDKMAVTRHDCANCTKMARVEVDVANLKSWVGSIDKKTWAVILLVIGNFVATVLK